MSEPLPPNPVEQTIYKLTFALSGLRTLAATILQRQESSEKKIEEVSQHLHKLEANLLLVASDLSHLSKAEEREQRTLEEIRGILSAQQLKLVETSRDAKETREDLQDVRKDLTPVRIQLPSDDEVELHTARRRAQEKKDTEDDTDPSIGKVVGAVVVIGKAAKRHWVKLSLAGNGGLLLLHGWDKVRAVGRALWGLFGG